MINIIIIINCRLCLQVVCGHCSSQKAALQFDDYRLNRVCDACFIRLSKSSDAAESDDDIYGLIDKLRENRTKTRSILKVNN